MKLKGIYSWIYISHLRRASALEWSKEKKCWLQTAPTPECEEDKNSVVVQWRQLTQEFEQAHKIHPNNPNELFTKYLSPFQNWKSLLLLTILVPLMFRMEKNFSGDVVIACFNYTAKSMCAKFVWQFSVIDKMSSMVTQMVKNVKNMPAVQETQTSRPWSLGQEDPLEKGMTTHSSILAWTEEPGGLESMALQRVRYDWATNTFT